ncbi:diguanylate cyclase domain-containing protein [Pseudomaricurvus hydrocarbonicus]|nr:diguanylate cyclase [Aestuariicella hydrocarbonica]
MFVPVKRYQCRAVKDDSTCHWQGILPVPAYGGIKAGYDVSGRTGTIANRIYLKIAKQWTESIRYIARQAPPQIDESVMGNFVDVSFEEMAQITLDCIGDAVLVVDPAGNVIYLNKVAETLTGWSNATALGRAHQDVFYIIDGNTQQRGTSPSLRAISENRIVALALGNVLIRRDGTGISIEDSAAPIHNRFGKIAGAVIVFHDACHSRVAIEKMGHLAQHDFLTGLPNRVLMMERLTQAIGMASRHGKQVALLFLDLDHFKQINDSFGHAVGDQLLREVAADIVACVRSTDTVSRHGGDEFIALLPEIEHIQDSAQVCEKLITKLSLPRVIGGLQLQIGLSIGISIYPDHGLDARSLVDNADTAMYTTKETGRNGYRFFRVDERRHLSSVSAFSARSD